jgi:hypothetical protein
MKKVIQGFLFATVLLSACAKTSNDEVAIPNETEKVMANNRVMCGTDALLKEQSLAHPEIKTRLAEIETQTQQFISNTTAQSRMLATGVLEVPVVWNVIYSNLTENISDAQLQSQLDALNRDFAAVNTDYNLTPAVFQSVRSGNCKISFVKKQTIRKYNARTSWNYNQEMKSTTTGGLNPTTPTTALNIWVVNQIYSNGGSVVAFAQPPGYTFSTDGVVLTHRFCGSIGTANISYYKLGRIGVHEVGHYFNLKHMWGDDSSASTCGLSDDVNDTPPATVATFYCPAFPTNNACTGKPLMTMNYMDYVDDPCKYMFTTGQRLRMQATFAVGGPRAGLR